MSSQPEAARHASNSLAASSRHCRLAVASGYCPRTSQSHTRVSYWPSHQPNSTMHDSRSGKEPDSTAHSQVVSLVLRSRFTVSTQAASPWPWPEPVVGSPPVPSAPLVGSPLVSDVVPPAVPESVAPDIPSSPQAGRQRKEQMRKFFTQVNVGKRIMMNSRATE